MDNEDENDVDDFGDAKKKKAKTADKEVPQFILFASAWADHCLRARTRVWVAAGPPSLPAPLSTHHPLDACT